MPQLLNDIKFEYKASTAESLGPADLIVDDKDVMSDSTFETAITITLGTDARASNNDILPKGYTTQRGYWANNLLGINLGCKLWLLHRSILSNTTVVLAKQYLLDGFQWMIDDGIISTLDVKVNRVGLRQLNFELIFVRPDTSIVKSKFYMNWDQHFKGN